MLTRASKFRDADTSKFTGSPSEQQETFRKLLCAVFSRPYDIGHVYDLQVMTKHAEYYCCLPIVSHSLWGPLVNSPKLGQVIDHDQGMLTAVAKIFRHAEAGERRDPLQSG
jgi:hypothetical protein